MNQDYKDKLTRFNATKKYREEMAFMHLLVDPQDDEFILDYGCGIGTMVRHFQKQGFINTMGYDYYNYFGIAKPFWYINRLPKRASKVYFMHSAAHIPELKAVFSQIEKKILKPGGSLCIYTPNRHWIDLQDNPDYKADPTVINHFTQQELTEMLKSCGFMIVTSGEHGEDYLGVHERIFVKAVKRG